MNKRARSLSPSARRLVRVVARRCFELDIDRKGLMTRMHPFRVSAGLPPLSYDAWTRRHNGRVAMGLDDAVHALRAVDVHLALVDSEGRRLPIAEQLDPSAPIPQNTDLADTAEAVAALLRQRESDKC